MIVIVHGWNGSGEGHWQRWLLETLRERGVAAELPELSDAAAPTKDRWVAEIAQVVERASTPVTLVCHSLGCWAVDHLIAERDALPAVRSVLLVAPPSPLVPYDEVQSFLPPPLDRSRWAPLAASSALVCGDDDLYATPEELRAIAERVGLPIEVLPGVGHLNPDSGYGPWPWVLGWLERTGAIPESPALR